MLAASLLLISVSAPPLGSVGATSLRFEEGAHSSSVRGVAYADVVDAWVTAGLDSTVRVWRQGKLERTLRFPTGPGSGGFYGCAVGRNGLLAVSDQNPAGPKIWLSSLKENDPSVDALALDPSDTPARRPTAFTSVAISPDGSRVAAGDEQGYVTVWDVATKKPRKSFATFREGSRNLVGVYEVAFSPDGNELAYAASSPARNAINPESSVGILDLRSGDPKPESAVSLPDRALCVDWPAPDRVYIGGGGSSLLRWRPGSETPERLDTGLNDPQNSIVSIAHSPDGKSIVAGSILGEILLYPNGATSPRPLRPVAGANATYGLGWSKDGRTIGAGYRSGEFCTFATDGKVVSDAKPGGRWIRGLGWTPDGRSLTWSDEGAESMGFDLAQSKAVAGASPASEDGHRLGDARIIEIKGGIHYETGGKAGQFLPRMTGLPVDAVFLDTSHMLVASSAGFARIDLTKTEQADGGAEPLITFDAAPTCLSLSPDRSKVAVGYNNGVIRIFPASLEGRRPLASIYTGKTDWVIWEEASGVYDCSTTGDSIFGFQVNRGENSLASFVPASMKEKEFRRPGLLPLLLARKPVDRPQGSLGDALAEVPAFSVAGIVGGERTDEGWEVDGDRAKVQVRVQNPKPGQRLSVRIGQGRARSPLDEDMIAVTPADGTLRTFTVEGLQPGPNYVNIFLDGAPIPGSEFVVVRRRTASDPAERLVVLSIGVTKYGEAANTLNGLEFPADDARAFTDTLKAKRFTAGEVVERTLTDEAASYDGIKDGLAWLQKTASGNDRVMVFIASHGDARPEGTFITPYDYDLNDAKAKGWGWPELTKALLEVNCRSLVLFSDSCHAGAATLETEQQMVAARTAKTQMRGAMREFAVFAACDADQISVEYRPLKHGLFTYALLQGLKRELPNQPFNPATGIVTAGSLFVSMPDYMAQLKLEYHDSAPQTPRVYLQQAAIPVSKVAGG